MDLLEKHPYEEPEDVENNNNNGNLQGIEEKEINENYVLLTTIYSSVSLVYLISSLCSIQSHISNRFHWFFRSELPYNPTSAF